MSMMMSSFQGPASTRIRDPLYTTICRVGQINGLKLCLDAGDGASYTSGQNWNDLSGNASHMQRGATSGSDATDPTFNGTAGANTIGEYFSFDGGDYFTCTVNPLTWVNNLFKNNAIGTYLGVHWINTSAGVQAFCGNEGSAGGIWWFEVNANNTFGWAAFNAALTLQFSITSTATMSEDAWHMVGFTIDEANNSHQLRIDGTTEAKTGTMPSPTAVDSNAPLQLGRRGTGATNDIVESGARQHSGMAWDRVLTAAEMNALYYALRWKCQLG